MRLAPNRNLLIGTTTDAASLSGGLIINGSGAGAAASSTVTGALRVTGGVGVSGAGYFGGVVSASGSGTIGGVFNGAGSGSTNNVAIGTSGGGSVFVQGYNAAFSTGQTLGLNSVAGGAVNVGNGATVTTINGTTAASSSTVGALTIGNGSAATNVAIGGGNVNAGGALVVGSESVNDSNTAIIKVVGAPTTLDPVLQSVVHISSNNAYNASPYASIKFGAKYTAAGAYAGMSGISGGKENATDGNYGSFLSFATRLNGGAMIERVRISSAGDTSITSTSPSTGSTSGALQVAGGIYAGAASVFGGTVGTGAITITNTGSNGLTVNNTAGNSLAVFNASAGAADANAYITLKTSGTDRWVFGQSVSTVAGDFEIYSIPLGASALKLAKATGAATFAGAVTANGQLIAKGTATNDSAAAGYIGEYPTPAVVLVGSAITLTTNTDANVTSISLTAGDWDVTGTAVFTGGAITGTRSTAGVSTVSATLNSSTPLLYAQSPSVPTVNADVTVSVPNVRISISSTTTVYLVSNSSFSAGTAKAYGCLQARRVR